jgi:hypothetical protein
MGIWQVPGGVGASSRIVTVVIVTTVTILIAAGCGPKKTPPPVVVAAGAIADCARQGDEATARLVGDIEGTVLTLGDHAYPNATIPPGDSSRSVPGPLQETTSTKPKGPQPTSTTSGR